MAEKLEEGPSSAGHSVTLEQVSVVGERTWGNRNLQLQTEPNAAAYDAVVFGSAVEGYSLSPVLTEYLRRVRFLKGKKLACLVTEFFPHPVMGGNRAIGQMCKLCKEEGASIVASAVVNWVESRREKTPTAAADRLSKLF